MSQKRKCPGTLMVRCQNPCKPSDDPVAEFSGDTVCSSICVSQMQNLYLWIRALEMVKAVLRDIDNNSNSPRVLYVVDVECVGVHEMHHADVSKVMRKRSPRRSRENSFEREDSPSLPVPPRRKTNALSILRKIFDEYDGVQSDNSSRRQQHGTSNFQVDANEDIPDHCWVGEYLDEEDMDETPTYSSHLSATTQMSRGNSRNLISSSGPAFHALNEVMSSHGDTDSYQTKFDDATDREIKKLQRKEREREEQLYKIMLESFTNKAELERLKREAALKKSKDPAKIFDYDHGVSDQSHERSVFQRECISSKNIDGESCEDQAYDLPHSSHQRHINISSEGQNSIYEIFQPGYCSKSSRKVERKSNSETSDLAYNSKLNVPQKRKADMLKPGYYDDHVDAPNRHEVTSMKVRGIRNQDVHNDKTDKVIPKYRKSSGAMSSFGSVLARTAKASEKETSQSYEEYLDELHLRFQEEELAMNSPRLANKALHSKLNQTPFGVDEGLPISVLTSRERGDSGNKHQSNIKNNSEVATPPLKVKPALKSIHKDAFKKEVSGSGSLIESLEEINATSRLNLGNFNDTRKVLMEESRQHDRNGNFRKLVRGDKVVINRVSPVSASLNDERFSRNTKAISNALKPTIHRNRRIENNARTNRTFSLDVGGTVDYESDDCDSEPFLHRTRPAKFEHDSLKTSAEEKKFSHKYVKSKSLRVSGTSPQRDKPSHGYSFHEQIPIHQTASNQSLEGTSKKMLKHLEPTRKSQKRSSPPLPGYNQKPSKTSQTRAQDIDDEVVETLFRHSSSRSMSREGSCRSSIDTKRHNITASKPSTEYIDQFFDRQIKIWSESSNKVHEKTERSVKRPQEKSKLTWEEEVDRYVNMSAGMDKGVGSAKVDRRDNVRPHRQRKRKRRSSRSYNTNDISAAIRGDSRSHSRTPSAGRRSTDSRSSLEIRARGQHESKKDERRFDTRSPLLKVKQTLPSLLTNECDIRRFTTSGAQSNLTAPIERLSKGCRGQLKGLESSPSPVPLMPADWRPAKVSTLPNSGKRNTDSITKQGRRADNESRRNVVNKEAQNEQIGNVVRKEVQNNHRMDVVSKEVGGNRKRKVPLSKSYQEMSDPKRGLEFVDGPVHNASQRSSFQARKSGNDRVCDDNDRSIMDSSRLITKSNASMASNVPLNFINHENEANVLLVMEDPKDAAVPLHGAPEKCETNSRDEFITVGSTVVEEKSVGQPTTTALPVRFVEEPRRDSALNEPCTAITHSTSENAAATVHSKSKKLGALGAKRSAAQIHVKAQIGNIQKPATSVGRGKKMLVKAAGRKNAPKTLLKPKLLLKRKLPADGKGIIEAGNVTTAPKPSGGSASLSGKTKHAISKTKEMSVNSCDSNWMEGYVNWFDKVLRYSLSNDELGKRLGWDDPVKFLNCVTIGNKRAMSYIPRGAHAKELLRFIALNKKVNNATPEAISEGGKIEEKSECSKVGNVSGADQFCEVPMTTAEHQRNQALDGEEVTPSGKTTVNNEKDNENVASSEKNSSLPGLGLKVGGNTQKNAHLRDSGIPENNCTWPHAVTEEELKVSKILVVPPPQTEVTSGAISNMEIGSKEKAKYAGSDAPASMNDPPHFAPSKQQTTSDRKSQGFAKKQLDQAKQLQLQCPDRPRVSCPQIPQRAKLVDREKKQVVLTTSSKHTTEQQLRVNESTEKLPTNVKSGHETIQKKMLTVTSSRSRRDGTLESHRKRKSSNEELSIPTEEPILSTAQKSLLPAFKKYVERATSRSLNILYEFDEYNKRKLEKVARDILDAFALSKQKNHGFTTQHALFYMASVFKDPSADSLDDVQRQMRKSDLEGPQFEFTVEAFMNFKNIVIELCKNHLDPKKSSTAQDEVKKNFVRQRSEYLFPQFSYEVDPIIKLWIWSERMQYIFRKESSSRLPVKLEPFPEEAGQTLEDRIVAWMKRVLHRRIYNEKDNYSHAVICAIKTELMKRKSHATRQEAMNLLIRLSIKEHFHSIKTHHKSQEKSPEPNMDFENSELMVLDEVYSDESEDENVSDIVDDSESVQIDLF